MVTKYCICRSTDGEGFMLQCESCDEWFHGRCVSITRKYSRRIDKYYCEQCRKIHNKEITYLPEYTLPKIEPPSGEKLLQIKQEPLEERKQGRKVSEITAAPKPIPVPKLDQAPPVIKPSPKKTTIGKKRAPKARSKGSSAVQCANLDCIRAARQDKSKYCSDECAYNFNLLRYNTIYLPKWEALEKNHSKARLRRMKEMSDLGTEKTEVEKLIKSLKEEKRETEENIKIIKEQAQSMFKERKKVDDANESSSKNEDSEEYLTGDNSRTFCITCGTSILRSQMFKHWVLCHRKHEDTFNLTAPTKSYFEDDGDPEIFCEAKDKKTGRFCRHLESACPFHNNWIGATGEVCACPLNIMQKLVSDGNYCLELKKECTLHYHWDKFRLASINMLRIQAFGRLETIIEKMKALEKQLDDSYGGVVGLILHNTIDHIEKEITKKPITKDVDMEVDVDM